MWLPSETYGKVYCHRDVMDPSITLQRVGPPIFLCAKALLYSSFIPMWSQYVTLDPTLLGTGFATSGFRRASLSLSP